MALLDATAHSRLDKRKKKQMKKKGIHTGRMGSIAGSQCCGMLAGSMEAELAVAVDRRIRLYRERLHPQWMRQPGAEPQEPRVDPADRDVKEGGYGYKNKGGGFEGEAHGRDVVIPPMAAKKHSQASRNKSRNHIPSRSRCKTKLGVAKASESGEVHESDVGNAERSRVALRAVDVDGGAEGLSVKDEDNVEEKDKGRGNHINGDPPSPPRSRFPYDPDEWIQSARRYKRTYSALVLDPPYISFPHFRRVVYQNENVWLLTRICLVLAFPISHLNWFNASSLVLHGSDVAMQLIRFNACSLVLFGSDVPIAYFSLLHLNLEPDVFCTRTSSKNATICSTALCLVFSVLLWHLGEGEPAGPPLSQACARDYSRNGLKMHSPFIEGTLDSITHTAGARKKGSPQLDFNFR
ncbi:hypothetical protein R3P38DRAFT_2763059 [Favolaschia claudopus]|uniref:Uncharacterized protein n=1 Tax=Favolaschia claudopus TaxID=2862362 RepID=A0AAW0DMF0_9AGAR